VGLAHQIGGEQLRRSRPRLLLALVGPVLLAGACGDDRTADTDGAVKASADLNHALVIDFAGGYVSTPDHANFAVSELDVRVFGQGNEDWKPKFLSTHLVGQESVEPTAWALTVHPNGKARMAVSGGEDFGPESDTNLGIPADTPYWLRSVVKPSSDGSGRTFKYWTSADGNAWVHRGTIRQPIPLVFQGSVSEVTIPGGNGALPWMDRIFYVEIRSSEDGPIIANPDFRQLPAGTTSFQDSTGKTWTLTGPATIG
jgi:hypothetical protein